MPGVQEIVELSQNVNNKITDQGVLSVYENSSQKKKTYLESTSFLVFEVPVNFMS